MPPRRQPAPDLETDTTPDTDADTSQTRRTDPSQSPPDSLPPRDDGGAEDKPAGGGFTPRADGGNKQHPIHDEDQEDAGPSDYERELDRLAAATSTRH